MLTAYYNEIEPYCCAWLSNLMDAGLITPGRIDSRDIREVTPDDVAGFRRCHFFAGIAGWDHALNIARWDDLPVWTGSPPCQPFSSAARGRNQGIADNRHLWPEMRRLIAECSPPVVFGEQVARAASWLDGVCDDVEALGYTVWSSVLPAVSVGKDHARHRIYFACYANGDSESSVPVNGEVAWMQGARGNARVMVQENGLSNRMAAMRALGNAIVPEVAAEFVGAFIDVRREACQSRTIVC